MISVSIVLLVPLSHIFVDSIGGVSNQRAKPLLWAGSRATRVNMTISGLPILGNYSMIL